MSVEGYARKYGMNAYDGVRVHVSNGGRDGTHSRVTSTFEAGHIPADQIYRAHQLRVASMEGYGIPNQYAPVSLSLRKLASQSEHFR